MYLCSTLNHRERTVTVLKALLWLRDFLSALKEIAKHPQTQAQTVKSTTYVEKTSRKFSLSFRKSRQIRCQFASNLALSSFSLAFCLSSLTRFSTDLTTSWEMPTWLRLEESRQKEGSVGVSHADTNLK